MDLSERLPGDRLSRLRQIADQVRGASARRTQHIRELGLLLAFVGLLIVFTFTAPNFFSQTNGINILEQASVTGILAVGETLIIISGNIDISIGSVAAFADVLAAGLAAQDGVPVLLAFLLAIAAGTGAGAANGAFSAAFRVPSFLVTLATLTVWRGAAFMFTNGFPISGMPSPFDVPGSGFVGPIPISVVIMAVVFLLGHLFLTTTRRGRYIFAIGGNAEAARLAGISVLKVRIMVFSIQGALAGLAGIVLASRLGAGTAESLQGIELQVIAAVIMGGTALFGGRGGLVGTLLGVLFITALSNGMILAGVSPFMQLVVQGLVVLVAVTTTSIRRRERSAIIT